ncbi:retropepsin-like aspartic protease family protein [Pontivivens ytuae]|uniref:TIGR02281 family clan AA aspartic protease n=1 Tax=Pontivivens ytuae TaxID=2789856 RepID=A0A7S9QD93_9RHOB|nr:TIGR02281 family clan AA aspartic protease [Pontivivens ytuae]QPH53901.1 TIGR02281 family clan AA aspartic protease [Pontivivens ytuae]
MGEQQVANLVYLVLLLIVLGGSFLSLYRGRLSRTVAFVVVWGLLFAALIVGYDQRGSLEAALLPERTVQTGSGTVEIRRRFDGHFYADLTINGTPVEFIVDTGASSIVISQRDAQRIGFDTAALDYSSSARTANGTVRLASIRLDEMTLGELTDRDVRAVVNSGDIETSLLGLDYLDRFERVSIENGVMVLER